MRTLHPAFPFAWSEAARRFALAALLVLALPACQGDDDDSTGGSSPAPSGTPAAGDDFISALSSNGSAGTDDDAEAGADDDAGDDDSDERTVEEADIFVQRGDHLYILNMYRGLQILDVSDPDRPKMQGRAALTGYPVEMYVDEDETRAYVVVSNYFTYWQIDDADTDTFHGSVVAVVDVADPEAPSILGSIDLEGYVNQTRRVGDVIYAVSTRYAYYSCDYSTDSQDETYVVSIDISDPAAPTVRDTESWPGTYAQVHATSSALYVAEPIYDYSYEEDDEPSEDNGSSEDAEPPPDSGSGSDPGEEDGTPADGERTPADSDSSGSTPVEGDGDRTPTEGDRTPGEADATPVEVEPTEGEATPDDGGSSSYYTTHITYVDISDPHGDMTLRGTIDVPGTTWDKFALNEFEDTFRIVTQKYDGVTSGTLSVIDVSDPDALKALSSLDIVLDITETVTAVRFDGTRGYVVTAANYDPLFIIDLSVPAAPRMAGQVEMPGQLTHLETLGDRIVALGMDNSQASTWLVAVSLFDVADMENPVLLDRETIGDDYSYSSATWDEKAFSLIEEEGLIALPFTAYDYDDYSETGGVQLMDFDRESLTKRGTVTHPGYVTRVRPVGDRLASLSDTRLLMIDATDRDAPQVTADVTLARYISDYLPMGDYGVQLESPQYGWYYYDYDAYGSKYGSTTGRLRVVTRDDADSMDDALATVDLDLSDGQLLQLSGSLVGLVRTAYDESWVAHSTLDVYDISSPAAPVLRSSTALPAAIWSTAEAYWYGMYYGSGGGVLVRVSDTLFAYLETVYDYSTPDVETGETTEPSGGSSDSSGSSGSSSGSSGSSGSSSGSSDSSGSSGSSTGSSGSTSGSSGSSPARTGAVARVSPAEDTALSKLHLIDVSSPDAPQISTFAFDQSLFGLRARGDFLFATHAVQLEGQNLARYYADLIDVRDPTDPVIGSPINIPGTVIGMNDDHSVMVTLESQWTVSSEGYEYLTYSVDTVGVSEGRAHLLDRLELDGYVYSVVVSADAAYVETQDYYWMADTASSCGYYYSVPIQLRTVSLADPAALQQTDTQTVPLSYGYLRTLADGRLFIDGYSYGMLVYDVATDPLKPAYQTFARTSGWALHVRPDTDRVYLPLGMYGVATVEF